MMSNGKQPTGRKNMHDEDKIFGLIIQAETIQYHALRLQNKADKTIEQLKNIAREEIDKTTSKEIKKFSSIYDNIIKDINNSTRMLKYATSTYFLTALVAAGVIAGLIIANFFMAIGMR
jgi:hypothetical protein